MRLDRPGTRVCHHSAVVEDDPAQDERKALEAFVVENEDLERLEALISEFNVFEAVGAVRSELRHSDFLAFLMDPTQSHGLGASFLRRFLQRALVGVQRERTPFSVVELDLLDLDEVEVRREWHNIDILVLDERNKFVIIIENKIDSDEHDDQLGRYWDTVESQFAGHRILSFYLTPDRDDPSDDRYLAIDHGLVADLVERFVNTRESTMGSDVTTALRQYHQMLRRHIVSNSEIANLCRRLYQKHRPALDLIFEHRPDPAKEVIRGLVEDLVNKRTDLILDDCTNTLVRFLPKQWDLPQLKVARDWTKTSRVLLFEFHVMPVRLVLKLIIGPGPGELRERFFRFAQARPQLFNVVGKSVGMKWKSLYAREFWRARDAEDEAFDAIEIRVRQQWAAFVTDDLPALLAALETEVIKPSAEPAELPR